MKNRKATPYSDQKNWSNTYLTDPDVVKALGPFDLDPCCPPKMPWRTARLMISHELLRGKGRIAVGLRNADGLAMDWRGRVFMNPPYRGVLAWAKKFAANGNGIALLNGRSSETRATQIIMARSRVIFFPLGRLTFFKVSGKPWHQKWFSSLLIGMTSRDAAKLRALARKIGGTVYERRPGR